MSKLLKLQLGFLVSIGEVVEWRVRFGLSKQVVQGDFFRFCGGYGSGSSRLVCVCRSLRMGLSLSELLCDDLVDAHSAHSSLVRSAGRCDGSRFSRQDSSQHGLPIHLDASRGCILLIVDDLVGLLGCEFSDCEQTARVCRKFDAVDLMEGLLCLRRCFILDARR